MKDLIDEASKVLKSISGAPSSSASSASSGSAKDSEGKEDLMERLQQQLNSLRQKQKVLRLQKMATGDQAGDSWLPSRGSLLGRWKKDSIEDVTWRSDDLS